ncbi:hypothetical protein PoB_000805000 [Plakobranchus ocellatus]|uniref:Uncharacterized protein n=1 Tax=Plakobranchus ocellatus TaxID=259542 RepID=A0AAV3YEQ7_9GAST|nr:hypothetical protein PoB_000805000 [Plakobranchus ocellatus]
MGDFNAKVGDERVEHVVGPSGKGTLNERGTGSFKASSKPLQDEALSASSHTARLDYDDKPPAWAAMLQVT